MQIQGSWFWHCTSLGLAAWLLVASPQAKAKGIELDSREYKLMLKPSEFEGKSPDRPVEQFVAEQLVAAVQHYWSRGAGDELAKKGMEVDKRRIVRFWDTSDCLLNRHGFAWRERVETDKDGRRADRSELALKFRSPDLFLADGVELSARHGAEDTESKLEEDLGPVAVRTDPTDGVAAKPRAARSQFSRSTSQTVAAGDLPSSLEGITKFNPSFEDDLEKVAGPVSGGAKLVPSPEYREVVYKSSKLDLTEGIKSAFALTLWYPADESSKPVLAEVSFKYDTQKGDVPFEAARAALDLLRAMQDLPWADPTAPTKTALVACDSTV